MRQIMQLLGFKFSVTWTVNSRIGLLGKTFTIIYTNQESQGHTNKASRTLWTYFIHIIYHKDREDRLMFEKNQCFPRGPLCSVFWAGNNMPLVPSREIFYFPQGTQSLGTLVIILFEWNSRTWDAEFCFSDLLMTDNAILAMWFQPSSDWGFLTCKANSVIMALLPKDVIWYCLW